MNNHFYYQTCIGDLFTKLLAPPPAACNHVVHFSGVLFHHHDMWVNPAKLLDPQQYDRNLLWIPERGLPNQHPEEAATFCASGEELARDCGWGWCMVNMSFPGQISEKEQALRALALVQPGLSQWPAGRVCRMHSDIFYVPVRFMAEVGRVAWAFNTTFHEVAIPTILHIALWEGEAREAFQHTHCNGSCCDRAGDDLANYTCAHRLDLTNRTVREKVVLTLLP